MSRSPLVNIKDLSVTVNGESLFRHLSFAVEPGQVVALIGPNGCGKSTVLNFILSQAAGAAGLVDDVAFEMGGSILVAPGISAADLPQVIDVSDARLASIRDATGQFRAGFERLCRELDVTGGIDPAEAISGGERQKLALAAVLAGDSDLYLLDEPTNYVDLVGITAFEHHISVLKQRGKGVILVTHDRTLTDNLADHTVLVTRHGIHSVAGGASAAWSVRSEEFESRSRRAKDIDKKIKQLQQDVLAKVGWSATSEKRKIGAGSAKPYLGKLSKKMAMRAKAVQRRAEREIGRLEEVKPFVPKRLNLHFPNYEIRNRDIFALREAWFDYSPETKSRNLDPRGYLLSDISLAVKTTNRFCLMGRNGSGKSTLIKLLLGQLPPCRGESYFNDAVRVVQIPQGLTGFFVKERLLDNFDDCGVDGTTVRQYLGSVLIRRDKVGERLSSFSQGELMRAAVVKCVLSRAEFLLLDEPTSHLDIESIDVLEQLLHGFKGGYLIISHDRSFVGNVATKLFMLDGGRLRLV
jgi:ATPase subunit of ABC transporter with duplicated ATPase domains